MVGGGPMASVPGSPSRATVAESPACSSAGGRNQVAIAHPQSAATGWLLSAAVASSDDAGRINGGAGRFGGGATRVMAGRPAVTVVAVTVIFTVTWSINQLCNRTTLAHGSHTAVEGAFVQLCIPDPLCSVSAEHAQDKYLAAATLFVSHITYSSLLVTLLLSIIIMSFMLAGLISYC